MKKVIFPFLCIFILGFMLGCKQETTTRNPMQYDHTKSSTGLPTPTMPKKK